MDFLGHLVDAPLANILIIAGLLFLGIGAVGKVTGKIEPDKFGRLMTGLMGLVLLAVGIVVHMKHDQPPTQPNIRAFSLSSSEVRKGDKVTITWDVSNADDVELQPLGPEPASGNKPIEVQQTTTYTLVATNKDGGRSSISQEVVVTEPPTRSKDAPRSGSRKNGGGRASNAGDASMTSEPTDDGGANPGGDAESDGAQPVYASQPPPGLPDYDQPKDPGGNAVWTPGSWYYDSVQSDYYWVPGEWVTPPNFEVWTPPYWGYDGTRYQWHAGYWSTSVGFYGGIDYGFGYSGTGYDRSRNKSRNPVSYNGGPRGVRQQTPPLVLAANRDRTHALDAQRKLALDMKKDPHQYFKVTHGHPLTVAVAKPDSSPPPSASSTPPHPVHPSSPPGPGSTPPAHPTHPSSPPKPGTPRGQP
ncbi:MAG: YXWGXW repeat-containing protein [Candidatus Sulfotelmatobacter sp.]